MAAVGPLIMRFKFASFYISRYLYVGPFVVDEKEKKIRVTGSTLRKLLSHLNAVLTWVYAICMVLQIYFDIGGVQSEGRPLLIFMTLGVICCSVLHVCNLLHTDKVPLFYHQVDVFMDMFHGQCCLKKCRRVEMFQDTCGLILVTMYVGMVLSEVFAIAILLTIPRYPVMPLSFLPPHYANSWKNIIIATILGSHVLAINLTNSMNWGFPLLPVLFQLSAIVKELRFANHGQQKLFTKSWSRNVKYFRCIQLILVMVKTIFSKVFLPTFKFGFASAVSYAIYGYLTTPDIIVALFLICFSSSMYLALLIFFTMMGSIYSNCVEMLASWRVLVDTPLKSKMYKSFPLLSIYIGSCYPIKMGTVPTMFSIVLDNAVSLLVSNT